MGSACSALKKRHACIYIPSMSPPSCPDGPLTSAYTYRHLQLLRQGSTASPLRVVAHIDLDAFYAQCEMVRLGTPATQPLAVQQWDALIAINYPAREFGITRMISASEARKRCPHITLQHVATFREGQNGEWAYRDDNRVATDKVSLDPYRAESRKILQVFKDELASWHDHYAAADGHVSRVQDAVVEKASVDEAFIDLSSLVYGVLLRRYPPLATAGDGALPSPPSAALEWGEDNNVVDLDEACDSDWDDVAMRIGSEIVRSLRAAVWRVLSYTSSAGIARNKMMAKLGSSCHKPNKQTVVRNRAIQNFLGSFRFTKIRMLGGKLGDQVSTVFGTEQVSELLGVSLDQFRTHFDDETAVWLHGIIRGDDTSEVNARTQMKSMASAKSFRPAINNIDQAERWLRIFVADIHGRLVEDGILENRRRPRTIALHYRQGGQPRSRQSSIPTMKPIDQPLLLELAKTLLRQAIDLWPCANLSLSVGGFEEGVKNKAIDGFLVRGEEARQISSREDSTQKKRRLEDDNNGIQRFFNVSLEETPSLGPLHGGGGGGGGDDDDDDAFAGLLFLCNRCGKRFPEEHKVEHDDWHFAMDLAAEQRSTHRGSEARGRNRNGMRVRSDKGQMRLNFGA